MSDPDPHEVHVWYRSTAGCDDAAVAVAWTALSPDERTRAGRFHFAEDRRDYVLAHDLLRRALSRHAAISPAEWQFERTTAGKPFLRSPLPASPGAQLAFSLAHTRGFVACALTHRGTVGVDVERLDRVMPIDTVSRWLLAPAEAAALAALLPDDQHRRLFELWTLKEAFVKATGRGLSQAVGEIVCEFTAADRLTLAPPPAYRTDYWHAALYVPEADVRLAIVLGAPDATPWRLTVRADDPPTAALVAVRRTPA